MKAAFPIAASLVALLAACGSPPLERGSELADGVYWRLNMLGDGDRSPNAEDSVRVRVRIARPGGVPGSVFSTERWYPMGQERRTTMFFELLHQGDSATVMLRSPLVPWDELGATNPAPAADTGWMQMELAMLRIRSLQESRELAMAALMGRTQQDETRILDAFFAEDGRSWEPAMGLWYVLDSLADRGPRVRSGEVVTLAYTARFLDNDRVFDEQRREDGGLTFRLGDPDQVIKGFEAACHLLPAAGGSGWFVIPSGLAFGPKGSAAAIVTPWTPVLYRITVLPPTTAK